MTITRQNRGTCSSQTKVTLNPDHTIAEIAITGGCNGNLNGISSLLVGMKAEDAIARMRGTRCGMRATSCPDQISLALQACLDQM